MKKRYLIVFLCLGFNSFAQHAVELDSKSLLIPRYTNLNEITNAITSPKQGMLVFNQSTGSNWQYNGFTWSNTAGSVSFPIIHSGNTSNPVGVLELSQTGTGSTSIFKISNNSNSADAVYAESNGSGNAIHGVATNNAVAGFFENGDPESSKAQLVTYNVGLGHAFLSQAAGLAGSAGRFENNPLNNAALLFGNNYGSGAGLYLNNLLPTGTNAVIWGFQNGLGRGLDLSIQNNQNAESVIKATSGGIGNIAEFQIMNPRNPNNGLDISTVGTGSAVKLLSNSNSTSNAATLRIDNISSGGRAGDFNIGNINNNSDVIFANTHGNGQAIKAISHGGFTTMISYKYGSFGGAGLFEIDNVINPHTALEVETNGTGTAFLARQGGTSGNIAIFQNNTTNVARIDKTGRGFFNGGTQSSGADLAEAFEVEGIRNSYEEGDILVISTTSDRKVEKSFEPYSNLVAGVYATKPGVLLTENEIDFPLFDHVPMGVIGVIPTKVCNEGGIIRRGDFIVSSSRKGFAMKGDPEKVKPGQIIGKALENFNTETGKIKVLVNIH
jgi:trimeric autotransporter adhesin